MIRVCITIDFFPFSGGARAIVSEIWKVLHEDWDIHFLTIAPINYSGPYRIHRLEKTRRHYVPLNPCLFPLNLLYSFWGAVKLLRLNSVYHFDVILTQDSVFTGLYSVFVGKLTGTKVIIMDYGATTNYLSDAYWNFNSAVRSLTRRGFLNLHSLLLRGTALLAMRITSRLGDRFTVLGYELPYIYSKILKINNSKFREISYSVDENFFSPLLEGKTAKRKEMGIPMDAIVINITCRLSQEKGIEYLMPALKQVVIRNGKVICLIVGSGIMKNFALNFIKENNLEKTVWLMGEAEPSRVRNLLQISDIFCYAGISGSNISLAVLEAMATNCAVVSTNSPKSHEKLLSDGRGIIVPIRDSETLGKALILLVNNKDLRIIMGHKARDWILKHHSLRIMKGSLLSLLAD